MNYNWSKVSGKSKKIFGKPAGHLGLEMNKSY
jgi:hypothetical protein